MLQRLFISNSIGKTIRVLHHSVNHTARHFQSSNNKAGICYSTSIINFVHRVSNFSHSSLSSVNHCRHYSNYTGPSKVDEAKNLSEDTESSDDDDDDVRVGSAETVEDVNDELSVPSNVPMAFHGPSSFSLRSHTCNELNLNHVGNQVSLYGWIESKRGENFIILQDGYGSVQICLAGYSGEINPTVPPESVIHVVGTVVKRSAEHINKALATGEIEVQPTEINVISTVQKRLPFSLKGHNKPKESLLLKHRYLHFRFPEMQETLRLRSEMLHKMRRYLIEDCSFVEVETPTLFGKTPGGAQEFVVPTRNKGKCYSLVQSPQQFKQMLMIGRMDRYFQVARCYRDEDSRADRQPEFTQLDLELSFANMEGVMNLTEQILKHSWPEDRCGPLKLPFPRMKYAEAMSDYGTDKPDLRYFTKISNYTNFLTPFFKFREHNNVRILVYHRKANVYTEELGKEVDRMVEARQSDRWPVTIKVFPYDNVDSFLVNLRPVLPIKAIEKLFTSLDKMQPGDLLVVGYGEEETVLKTLGSIRVPISKLCGIEPSCRFAPLWITHFPLFKKGPLIGKFKPVHHPFTNITKTSLKFFVGTPLNIESFSYDLVINGQEIGGGSERIRDAELQEKVLKKIGADPKDFEYFLNALRYGCPPHAGIALGLDRLFACLRNAESIRDVIAFPKTFDGVEPLTGAPSTPSKDDKALYRLK